MRCAWGAPAPKENVEADDEIDKADDAQAELKSAIQRIVDSLDGRFERNPVARDGVVNLSVGAGGVERAFQTSDQLYGGYAIRGRLTDPGQKISNLNAGALPRLIREDLFGLQTSRRFAPPYAVIGLRKLPLLQDIQHRQHDERRCGQGQQRSLYAVKKACPHERSFSTSIALPARRLPRSGEAASSQKPGVNLLRTIVIWTLGGLQTSTRSEVDHIAGAKNKSTHPKKGIDL